MPEDYTAPLASRIVDIATTLIADARHLPSDTAALTLADKVLRDLQRLVEDCRAPTSGDRVFLLRELAAEVTADLQRRVAAAADNNGVCGLRTGMRLLDSQLNGWEPGRVYMLGAASNSGKTTLALQWASYVAGQGKRALYISLENSRRDLRIKDICRTGHLSYQKYLHGAVDPAEWDRASARVDAQVGDRLAVYCPDSLARPLATVMEEAMQRMAGKPDFVVVDYLQKAATGLVGSVADDERQAIGRYVASIRQVAQQYECAVLAISSLNRASKETANKGSRTADLGAYMGSSAIEYGTDVAMLLFDETDTTDQAQMQSPLKHLRLKIVKNREGKASGAMPLEMYGDYCCFQEAER